MALSLLPGAQQARRRNSSPRPLDATLAGGLNRQHAGNLSGADDRECGRLDCLRRYDFWGHRTVHPAIQRNQAEGGHRGLFPLRLSCTAYRQHSADTLLVILFSLVAVSSNDRCNCLGINEFILFQVWKAF